MSNPKKISTHMQDEYNSFSDEEIELDKNKTSDKHVTHKNAVGRAPVGLVFYNLLY